MISSIDGLVDITYKGDINNGSTQMTNQTIHFQIITLCNTLGYGVNFRGGSEPHLATVTAREGDTVVKIVSGKLAKVLDYIEAVAA